MNNPTTELLKKISKVKKFGNSYSEQLNSYLADPNSDITGYQAIILLKDLPKFLSDKTTWCNRARELMTVIDNLQPLTRRRLL